MVIQRVWEAMFITFCASTWQDIYSLPVISTLQWRHNGRGSVSNHRRLHCLLHSWFRWRSKKTSKLRVTGLCAGNSPVIGEFPAQKASNAETVSIWWRHHDLHPQTILSNHTTCTFCVILVTSLWFIFYFTIRFPSIYHKHPCPIHKHCP